MDILKVRQLFEETRAELNQPVVVPSTLEKIKEGKTAQTALQLIQAYNKVGAQPMPKTYEDLAKIVKIQTAVKPAYEPMGVAEYLGKKMVSLVEKPFYALGEGSAAALEAGAKIVGLKGVADYFKESKEMWKTPPITEDVNEQFAWLLESAKKKSTMHGMVVEMAEIGVQIGSLLIQMGLFGKVPGVKAIDLTMFAGTAPLAKVSRQMGAMFVHGVATTPGDLSNRFTAGVTRMAYNMTPYIANWTGATGWGARLVDTALNTFLTSPSYIKSMKAAKNPMEFVMMAMPQFMTDVIFALNTTGTPMNKRLVAMGQRPSVFGTKVEEKEAFLKGVDKAIAETERPYGEEAPEPTRKQVVDSAIRKARVQKAEEGVIGAYKEGLTIDTEMLADVAKREGPIMSTTLQRLWGKGISTVESNIGGKGTYPAIQTTAYTKNNTYIKTGEKLDVKTIKALRKAGFTVTSERAQIRVGVDDWDWEDVHQISFKSPKGTPENVDRINAEKLAKMSDILMEALPKGVVTTALVPSKIPAKRITAGEKPGIMVTKTEHKKRLALSKKAVQEARIDELVAPINEGRKLSAEQLPRVATENREFWEKIGYGWGVLHLGNMRPERMLEEVDGMRQGPNTELMYGKINEGANNEIVGVTKDTDAQNAAITKLGFMSNVDRFYAERKHVGTRWVLTKNEMVEVYKNMQNPKAIKHLTKSKALNGMGFSKEDLADIKAEVERDPQMKGLADWQIAEYRDVWYDRVAPIFFMETGKILPREAYYSPIMVQKEFLDFEKDNLAQEMYNRYHIDGYIEKGFTMERKAGATQPIKLDAIGNHLYNIRRMQHYVNFALPLKEFRAVMNHPRWREAVTAQKGPIFYRNIKKYYDAVAGTKPAGADEIANKAMGFLRTNAGTAMLGFNILTAMRQPLSIFQATAEISLPHILSAIRQIGLDPSGLEKFVYDRSNMVKYRRGQFERFMTETEVSLPELLGKPRAPKAVTGRKTIRDRAMGMAIFMDKQTVLCTWKAAYDKVTQTGKTLDGEKIPVKDLEKAACMEADLAVRRTQPMATVKDLPAWHRSSSWLKMFTMFQNQINNNYNYFAHDIIGKTRAGKITPLQAAQKTLFAYILPAMLLGMIARGGFPRNKKQIAEDMIAFPTSGLFFAGGIINAMVKGYSDYGIPPLQFAPDLVKMVTSKKWATKGKFGLKGLAEVSGIPYNQLARTWKGMQALMAGETDDWRRLVWSAYSLEKGLPKPVKGGLKVFKRKE